MALQSSRPQARRSVLKVGVLALLSMSIAGCQLIPRQPPRQPPPPIERVPEPEQPEPITNLPRDETRNRVAVLVPLSGSNAGVGQSIANAANLALLDTGGERIRITTYDTARGALAAANEALADGNGLFLGPLLADDVRAVASVARRAQVPVISFSNDISVAGAGAYIMGFNPAQSIDRVVSHARSSGAVRFGALIPTGVYGQRASQAMIAAVERAGGRMIGMQTYDRSQGGIQGAASRLNGQGQYDAVLIADGTRIAVQAVPILRRGSAQVRILGTELWASETGIGAQPALRGAWYAAASETMFNQFRTRYRARYNANPYRLASLGYDSVLLAVRVAADWPVGRRFPERAIRDETGFAGVDGAFRFGAEGIAERALAVLEVAAAGSTMVSAAPRGFD